MKLTDFNSPCSFSTVFFGKFTVPDGGKPFETFVRVPMEWLVLESDSHSGKALLLSKYAVDWESFSNCPFLMTKWDTSWEESYQKEWLNGDFYNESFTEAEKEQILSVTLEDAGEKATPDKVFLLSADQVKKYFSSPETAVAYEPMINSVNATGKEESPIDIGCYTTCWWTRTSGKTKDVVMCVSPGGELYEEPSGSDEIGVRPAVWVKLSDSEAVE